MIILHTTKIASTIILYSSILVDTVGGFMEKDLYGVCPYVTAQKILSGKWTIIILEQLGQKTMRFNELQRALPEMTQATLSKQLHSMEANGLIIRTVYNQIPPKVEYSLAEMGKQFAPVLDTIKNWGNQYINYLNDNKK
jgi:DNA-binding HxlR family transcriptional regulator